MAGRSNARKRRLLHANHIILRYLIGMMMLGATATGCTSSDPRLDDSDVFGSPTPSAAAPTGSPS